MKLQLRSASFKEYPLLRTLVLLNSVAFGARYLFRSIGDSGQYPQRHWLQRRCKVNQNKSKKMHLWRQRRPSPMEALYLVAYVIGASLIPLTISGQNDQYQGRLIYLKFAFFVCLYSVVKLKQIAGNPPLSFCRMPMHISILTETWL